MALPEFDSTGLIKASDSEDSSIGIDRKDQFDFINRELTGTKLTPQLLLDLLDAEIKRKDLLETRIQELRDITKVKIKERTAEIHDSVQSSITQASNLRGNVKKVVRQNLPNRCDDPEFYSQLDQIDQLEKSKGYILVVNFIIFLSEKLNSNLREGNHTEAIMIFRQLSSLKADLADKSVCSNLAQYCSNVLEKWNEELQQKYLSDFEKLLEKLGWPNKVDTTVPSDETVKKFQVTTRCMSRLTGSGIGAKSRDTQRSLILIDYPESPQLVEILMKPLRKRFRYHFCSSKPTADDTKPEWYFTQVKHWIRDLVPFLGRYVEPLTMEESGQSTILPFVFALSELLIIKSDYLLSASGNVDDVVFSKILEESIRYESETKLLFEELKLKDREEAPGFVSTLFSQHHVLSRWLAIEKRGSLEKLDTLFASSSAWNRVVIPGPTEIGELFVMMLRFTVDRFAHLRQPGQKIQFVQLIIEILDDFRIRILQVWNSKPEVSNLDFLAAETLGYVHGTLKNWEELPFFSTLDFFWEKIRRVEKEDLELRVTPKSSRSWILPQETEERHEEERHLTRGLFTEIQEKYADSMENILLAISKK